MATIQDYLNNILKAVYGKDVRQSIHDAIQQCYYDGKAGAVDLEAREMIGNLEYNKFDVKLYCSIDCININSDDAHKQIDRAISLGCTGIYVCVHLNDNCTSYKNIDLVGSVFEYCEELNMNTVLKIHYDGDMLSSNSENQTAYLDTIKSLVSKFSVDTVFILNEETSVYGVPENTNFVLNAIDELQKSGVKCGISFSGNTDFLTVYNDYTEIINRLDIIGMNVYPEISYNGKHTSVEDSCESWERYLYLLKCLKEHYPEKKVCITETGIGDAWENLAFPWHYDDEELDTVTPSNGQAQRLYFEGMFRSSSVRKMDSVCLWFIEQYNYSDFISFFKNNVR